MSASAILAAVVMAVVALAVLVVYGLAMGIAALLRLATGSAETEPTLLDRVDAIRPPRNWFGRVDRGFDRLIQGTNFGISTDRAMEVILLMGALGGVATFIGTQDWVWSLLGVVVGAGIPLLIFTVYQNRRRAAIQLQLPDACFQLARCLRAGLSLPVSLNESAAYLAEPISPLFRKAAGWSDNGMPMPDAFQKLSDEVRLTDFDTMSALIALQSDVGGNLPAVLDRLAVAIRERNQYRGYYKSVTSLSRVTAIFVAMAAPLAAILYAVFVPDLFSNFFKTPLGIGLLISAAVLEVVGVVWILWLLSRRERF